MVLTPFPGCPRFYLFWGCYDYNQPDGSTLRAPRLQGKLSVQSGRRMSNTSGDASPGGGGREQPGTTPSYNPWLCQNSY